MVGDGQRQIFVVEAARRRVVVSAREAGRARAIAATMLYGEASAPERDTMVVREPEEQERAEFEARRFAPGSEAELAAIEV